MSSQSVAGAESSVQTSASAALGRLSFEPLFVMQLEVGYAASSQIGPTAAGHRAVYPVDGGTFQGERLRGIVRAGGADWVTQRSDDLMLIDVRLTLETDDGAIIGMTYTGIARAMNAALMQRFRQRELLAYHEYYLRTTPRFETGDERYAWLNGVIAVANGQRMPQGGLYQVFAIT